jgi:hypothetical protein
LVSKKITVSSETGFNSSQEVRLKNLLVDEKIEREEKIRELIRQKMFEKFKI